MKNSYNLTDVFDNYLTELKKEKMKIKKKIITQMDDWFQRWIFSSSLEKNSQTVRFPSLGPCVKFYL